MGAQQSTVTKHTFIDVDTRSIDDSTEDPRKVKSWGSPSTPFDRAYILFDGFDSDAEDHTSGENLSDEWSSDGVIRLTTTDPWDTEHDGSVRGPLWYPYTEKHGSTPQTPKINATSETVCANDFSSLGIPCHSQIQIPVAVVQMPVAKIVTFETSKMNACNLFGDVADMRDQIKDGSAVKPVVLQTSQQGAKEESRKVQNSKSTWTSRMLKNIPNDYTRQDILDLLDSKGIQYDFIYVPIDWGKRANLGYAFVNLISHEEAERIEYLLGGFSAWTVSTEKVCDVAWGKVEHQSLHQIIDRFRNSPVMHPQVPEEFKPLLFTLGQRTVFPAPTKKLRPPRGLFRKNSNIDDQQFEE